MQDLAICNLSILYAIPYGGIILLGAALAHGGDRSTDCTRDSCFETKVWVGPCYGTMSFDDECDAAGLVSH